MPAAKKNITILPGIQAPTHIHVAVGEWDGRFSQVFRPRATFLLNEQMLALISSKRHHLRARACSVTSVTSVCSCTPTPPSHCPGSLGFGRCRVWGLEEGFTYERSGGRITYASKSLFSLLSLAQLFKMQAPKIWYQCPFRFCTNLKPPVTLVQQPK